MIAIARVFLLTCLCCFQPAIAHHAMDLKDATPLEVRGEIIKASWDGAHVVYELSSRNANGELATWRVMGASPKILRERGISKRMFPVGDTILVLGRLDPHMKLIAPDYFITEDGGRFEMGFYPPTMKARTN